MVRMSSQAMLAAAAVSQGRINSSCKQPHSTGAGSVWHRCCRCRIDSVAKAPAHGARQAHVTSCLQTLALAKVGQTELHINGLLLHLQQYMHQAGQTQSGS